ncbi:MAG: hypothetical protein QMD92_08435 [bacterium]|nr:hypothetical protein [bacterium]
MNINKSKIDETELNKTKIKFQQNNKSFLAEKAQILKTSIRIKDSKEEESPNENGIADIAKENLCAFKSKVADAKKAKILLTNTQAQILEESNTAFIAHSNLDQSGLSKLLSS